MSQVKDWNNKIIEEFRANGGKVGGFYEGAPLLLLTTTGRKSGKLYTVPLGYQIDGERLVVLPGSGRPDWYYNLKANPRVKVEVNGEAFEALAQILDGEQKAPFLKKAREMLQEGAARSEEYAEMAAQIPDDVPVVALERISK